MELIEVSIDFNYILKFCKRNLIILINMAFVLHLRVIEAKNLAKMDVFSKSDPYVVIKMSGSTIINKTHYKKNTLTPRWNEEFHIPVSNPSTDMLHLKMYDKDVTNDDSMATLDIPLSSLPLGRVLDQWYDMVPCQRVKKGGEIHLVLQVTQQGAQPFVQIEMSPYMTMTGMPMMPPPMYPGYQGMPPPGMQAFAGAANTMMGLGNAMMGAVPQNYPAYPGMPMQPGMQQPGMPMQPGVPPPGMPMQPGVPPSGMPMQPGMQQPGMPMQPGMQPGMPMQPGVPPPGMQQPGMPMQPGMQAGTMYQMSGYPPGSQPQYPPYPPPNSNPYANV